MLFLRLSHSLQGMLKSQKCHLSDHRLLSEGHNMGYAETYRASDSSRALTLIGGGSSWLFNQLDESVFAAWTRNAGRVISAIVL